MATERQAPDAVVSSSGLDVSGGISAVQDDPDSPDANWFTSTATNGSLRVSFPTPTGAPNTGAGLQEFRVQMRKDASGGNDPTYTAELRETGGGSALQTLATDVAIASATGEVESLTWDASNLGTPDGSAVELLLTLSKAGGGPNERNIEIGAVEWNVDYSTAQQFEITGDVTVTPSIAATMDYDRNPAITGDVTVPTTIAATTQHQKNPSISGSVTVPTTIAATMSAAGSSQITGDVTVPLSVGATLQYQRNASLQGSVTVSPSVASVMDYDLNAGLSADVQLQLTVAAAMQYEGNAAIQGDVTLSLLASATLDFSGTPEQLYNRYRRMRVSRRSGIVP